jgi:hypothetical protein
MPKRPAVGLDVDQKEFVKLLSANAHRHRKQEVFRDFCELAALSISNSVDRRQFDAREARYMDIVKRYNVDEVARFPQMMGHVVNSLENGFHDCLGQLFMSLELGDHWKGQFFTPYELCHLMGSLGAGDVRPIIEQNGFFTANEPASGAGAMIIGLANAIHDQGLNFQQCMHVTAQDLDETAVHMTYIQLSLLHIPGVVIHGNSLAVEQRSHWLTPAHILGMWDGKLARRESVEALLNPHFEARSEHGKASTPVLHQNQVQPIDKLQQLDLFS